METTIKKIISIAIILISGFLAYSQPAFYISLKQRTEILENQKKITSDVDVFYDNNKQTITRHFYSPKEFITVANALGETKTYFPANNEVSYMQLDGLSSKRNLIYYFTNNLTDHLGLADEGFTLISNNYENQFYVTTWKAPSTFKGVENVKMVFENGLPIYSEYLAPNKKVLKKIYYSGYQDFTRFRFPQKVIEISFTAKGDSTINRTQFQNVKVTSSADSKYFNFKIPENAKDMGTTKGH